jgi:MFS family permease
MTERLADSRYAWTRLGATLLLMTIGSAAMYVVSVVLPTVQAEFGVQRADASMPYTLMMVGFGIGGIFMGRLADRIGVMKVVLIGVVGLSSGFFAAGMSGSLGWFAVAHGLLLGAFGSAATFAPLVADTSLWFVRRRGIAVAICASGNYLAGAIWPPIVQHFVESAGWRPTYIGLGVFCLVTMPLLALRLRPPPPVALASPAASAAGAVPSNRPFGLGLNQAQILLCVAGVACCVAMAMPQVHIVAYCGDLGYGAARGAEMLSLMLACGIVSRLVSGAIATASAACEPCCSARCCRALHCSCSSPSTGSFRCTSSRRCSDCSRAASCPATRSSCASTFRPRRLAPASAPC